MNFNFLISFGVGLAIYLLVLFIIFLVKRHKYKKSFDKETKEKVGVNDGEKKEK